MYRWIKVFQLSKTISKINFSFLNFRYKLKERPDTYFIVLTCFVLSIIGVFYYYYFQMLGQLYDGLFELGLGALFCRLALFAVAMILSVASAFLLINIFCFSKDIEHLLLFPVRPCDIFTSKYITVILFCYGIEILLLLPVCIIQTQYMGDISAIITYISAAAILPHIVVFPLAVLVTICLKIAMLLKRMKTMLVVSGILVYFAGGVIGVLLSNGQIGTERGSYIRFYPGLKLFCIILPAVFIGGYYYLSNLVIGKKYAIYDKEGRIRLKAMKYNSSSKLRSYFKKEYQTFFRNPAYVINGLFGIFITPFLLPLSFQSSATAYAVPFALAVIVLTSAINVVASSSFSREGASFWITKLIPYPLKKQAFVKALFSTSISIMGIIINCLIFKVYFNYGFIQIGIISFVGILFAALWNLIGVFIDMKRPKLEWTNETEAIKQNVNVVLSVLLCIAISIGYFFAVAKMLQNGFAAEGIITFLLCSVCILILLVCKGIASHQE
jgi:ABC-2 type transport system permease protein